VLALYNFNIFVLKLDLNRVVLIGGLLYVENVLIVKEDVFYFSS